jgi:hypothetical protein
VVQIKIKTLGFDKCLRDAADAPEAIRCATARTLIETLVKSQSHMAIQPFSAHPTVAGFSRFRPPVLVLFFSQRTKRFSADVYDRFRPIITLSTHRNVPRIAMLAGDRDVVNAYFSSP